MSQPSPFSIPPELLDRDRLSDLLDLLRDHRAGGVALDLSSLRRMPTPLAQLLAAAARDGVALKLTGLTPPIEATLRLLGLDPVLRAEQVA